MTKLADDDFSPVDKDVVAQLYEWYQQQKQNGSTLAISQCFADDCKIDNSRTWWRSTFTCPLRGWTVACPATIFTLAGMPDDDMQGSDSDPRSVVQDLTIHGVGNVMFRRYDGEAFPYFASKKFARKACALAVLRRIHLENVEDGGSGSVAAAGLLVDLAPKQPAKNAPPSSGSSPPSPPLFSAATNAWSSQTWTSLNNSGEHAAFFYTLTFSCPAAACGKPWRAGQLGLILPVRVQPLDSTLQVVTFVPAAATSNDETVQVHMSGPTACPLAPEQLMQLQRFNRQVMDWKQYGLHYQKYHDAPEQSPYWRQVDRPGGRTYLLAPLHPTTGVLDWELLAAATTYSYFKVTRDNVRERNELLSDRVLVFRQHRYSFVPDDGLPEASCTAASPFPYNDANMSSHELENNRHRYNLDLQVTTFAEYFAKRWNMPTLEPHRRLVKTLPIKTLHSSYVNGASWKQTSLDDSSTYLIPEHVWILPIPISMLTTIAEAPLFMLEIERNINIAMHAKGLFEQVGGTMDYGTGPFSLLLKQATTKYPTGLYERLEFLGDAVLGYMIATTIFISNGALHWGQDSFEGMITGAGKNAELARAFSRLGLENVVRGVRGSWSSAYAPGYNIDNGMFARRADASSVCKSDIFESFLAACYSNAGVGLVPMIMREASLPIIQGENSNIVLQVKSEMLRTNQFDLETNQLWGETLDTMSRWFTANPTITTTAEARVDTLYRQFQLVRLHSSVDVFIKCAMLSDDCLIRRGALEFATRDFRRMQDSLVLAGARYTAKIDGRNILPLP